MFVQRLADYGLVPVLGRVLVLLVIHECQHRVLEVNLFGLPELVIHGVAVVELLFEEHHFLEDVGVFVFDLDKWGQNLGIDVEEHVFVVPAVLAEFSLVKSSLLSKKKWSFWRFCCCPRSSRLPRANRPHSYTARCFYRPSWGRFRPETAQD